MTVTRLDLAALLQTLLPSLIAGGGSWLIFMIAGGTPPIRAAALAASIAGVALILRPMGALLAVLGAMALAVCPAYWTQTGGVEGYNPLVIIGTILFSVGVGFIAFRVRHDVPLGIGAAGASLIILVLVAQYIGIGGARSLRLTTILVVALTYLLIDALRFTNPRPDEQPTNTLGGYYWTFILGVFAFGILNDPMVTLFAPAVLLAITLSKQKRSLVYWLILGGVIVFGAIRLINVYYDPDYWVFPAQQAININLQTPFMVGGAWREGERWVNLISFLTGQFTWLGTILGIVGLARLARWYPPIGIVSLVAFGMYGLFSLLYFGGDAAVLMLPLLIIQILWITYALASIRDWFVRATGRASAEISQRQSV